MTFYYDVGIELIDLRAVSVFKLIDQAILHFSEPLDEILKVHFQ